MNMNTNPITYTPEQQKQIQEFIDATFGADIGCIAHEIESEYVHTDVSVIAPEKEPRTLVTFGMGAREMTVPDGAPARIELVMSASSDLEIQTKAGAVLLAELTAFTKFPFRHDTWLGAGHTANVSQKCKERFGYDCVLFAPEEAEADIDGVGTVKFLRLIPIYKDEREWIMENDSFDYMNMLYSEIGEDMFLFDKPRAHFIPDEDEAAASALMHVLNIDRAMLDTLQAYYLDAETNGEEITYEKIAAWIEEIRNEP